MFSNYKSKSVLAVAAICVSLCVKVHAQDKSLSPELYTASGIPDSLKEDANSVIRYRMEDYKVEGPGKITYKEHSIITVLNEKANDEAIEYLPYVKRFNNINSFEMRVYDANGQLLKKYHKSDMYDGAASSDMTLVSDDRFLALKHSITSYPETIEVTVEESRSSVINIGHWRIQRPDQSIQNSYCHLSINSDAGFRYNNKNTDVKPQKDVLGNTISYLWQVSNLKAFKREESSMQWRVIPEVRFAANKFEYFGLPGDFSSWQNFGKWQQSLNADVSALSPLRTQEIKKMTDTIKNDKEKAKFLYKYMQQNMRYVSIQLGIGGLKPFPASFVDEKKYGDCKALVNYMRALLQAAGINSYYAVVKSGENEEPVDYSFPYDRTDHIILCVPFKNDTTWLECTSNKAQFGRLGAFTENRNALLITEDGGRLINTPKSIAPDNQFNSEVHIQLQPDGGAKAHIKVSSTGEYRFLYMEVDAAKLDEQKQFWLSQLGIKQPSAFDLESGKDVNYTKQVDINLEYDKFCDVMAGDKQFYKPAVFQLWANTVPVLEKRRTDFYWEYPRIKSCTTTIDLPQGFEVETMPTNTNLKFTYGNYDISYVYNKDKNQVIGTAKFVLNNNVIPAAKYTEMQEYMDNIARAQNKKLVIRKKT